ncbi:unnamed protein product, partial [Heterotrigona itama]
MDVRGSSNRIEAKPGESRERTCLDCRENLSSRIPPPPPPPPLPLPPPGDRAAEKRGSRSESWRATAEQPVDEKQSDEGRMTKYGLARLALWRPRRSVTSQPANQQENNPLMYAESSL